jgi:hypothetical protein
MFLPLVQREVGRVSRRANSLAGLVYQVLPAAYAAGTGDGALPISARSLYYQVRPRLQQHTDRDLAYNYFAYNLLPAYQREQATLPGLYYDPRGELHEPHTGMRLQLGTREVARYSLPAYTFNKLLYVEKKGLWPVLQQVRLAERYDMAVVVGEGQPVEAIRELCERANSHAGYRVFVLHDADHHGYSIARTLAEATTRMPDHWVEVTDLGLTVEDAITAGLPREDYTRTKALPSNLDLTPTALEWFTGEPAGDKRWRCQRVELNAFTGPDLVAYIEAKLEDAGATDKIVPPQHVLLAQARGQADTALRVWAENWLAEHFDLDRLAIALADRFVPEVVTDPAAWVTDAHQRNRATWWKQAIANAVDERVDEIEDQLEDDLRQRLQEQQP